MSQESYEEHRARDEKTASNFLLLAYFFPSIRWLIPVFLVLIVVVWGFNILGESTILNNKEIYYSGTNPWTGKMEVIQGCRPEHLDQNRQCTNQLTMDTIKKAFPFFGPSK
jgi:hypothetical protein